MIRARISINRWELAELILVAYLTAIYAEYRLGDLLVYLPMALYLRNPALYPGSTLVRNLLAMPYPVYRLYAWIYDQRALFAIFLGTRVLLVGALYLFGTRLIRDKWSVWLGLILVLFTPPTFGTLGNTAVLLPDASQQALAAPWFFLALALSLGGQDLLSFVVAGLAFNLHPILGTATLALLTGRLLLVRVWMEREVPAVKALGYIGLAVLLTLPVLAMTWQGIGTQFAYSSADFVRIVRFTLYFHLFPSTFEPQEYFTTALTLVFLALALRSRPDDPERATVLIWLGIIAAFCAVGTVFSEIIPEAFVLKLMPFRSTLFLKVIGLFYAGVYLRSRLDRDRLRDYAMVGLMLFGFLVNAGVLLPALGLDLLLTYGVSVPGLAGAAAAAAAIVLALAQGLNPAAFPSFLAVVIFDPRSLIGDIGGPNAAAAVTLVLVFLLAHLAARRGWRPGARLTSPGYAAALGLVVVLPIILVNAPPPLNRRIQIPYTPRADDLEDMARWAREHTPTDTVVITPPDADMARFTLFSERGTLGNFKEAGQAVLDPQYASTIYQRLADLGCRGPWMPWCWGNTYGTFDAAQFRSLAARYGACAALTAAPQQLDLPELYHNASYHLYSLCK